MTHSACVALYLFLFLTPLTALSVFSRSLVDFFNEFNHYLDHAGPLLAAEFGVGVEKRLQVSPAHHSQHSASINMQGLGKIFKRTFSKCWGRHIEYPALQPPALQWPAFSSHIACGMQVKELQEDFVKLTVLFG